MKRILVVTDDESFLELLGGLIADGGYHLIISPINRHAARLAHLESAHLVLIDARDQQPAAMEVVDLLKIDPQTAHIAVVIYAREVDDLRAVESMLGHTEVEVVPSVSGPQRLLEAIREEIRGPSGS